MSKTFASHPASVSSRGRGRGRPQTNAVGEPAVVGTGFSGGRGAARGGRGAPGGNARGGGGRGQRSDAGGRGRGTTGGQDPAAHSSLQERATHAGAYTVIRPDEKRRREVTQQAEREAKRYEQFKKQNTPASFSYVGTAGGGEATLAEARQQQIRTQAQHSKASRLVREQERRSQQRQIENRAVNGQQQAARAQANRQTQRERNTQADWKHEMKRVNQAFLDRLEAQAKNPGPSPGQT